ncbi:MAG: immunoglobulin domain-containing protein [Candidatus Kapaibacteriales bacterium]
MNRVIYFFSIFLLIIFGIYRAFSQPTYPAPYNLSLGNYSFTNWAPTNPAQTYPPNMRFHRTSTQDPQLSTEMTTDYTLAYNLASGSRINGLGTDGFSFVNTGTNGNLGSAVLAINTTDRTNIRVTWTGGFVKILGTTSREYHIILQYRIGNVGTFQNVTDEFGNPVEYAYNAYVNHPNPTTLPPHSQTFSVTLPPEVEDQPIVYLRWKYYFLGSGSGNRPELRVDDIFVESVSSVGGGTKLAITNVQPPVPLSNVPFSIRVNAVDDNNISKKVSQNTTVRLSLISGSGTLSGTLVRDIPYKSTYVIFDNLSYSAVGDARIKAEVIAGDPLAPAEADLQFIEGPVRISIEDVYPKGHISAVHPSFTLKALNSDGSVNTNYHNFNATVYFTGPNNFSQNAIFINGVATVSNVIFNTPGFFSVSAVSPGISQSNTVTIEIKDLPVVTEIFIPRYIKGVGTFNSRVPAFALIRVDNLHPNTEYRFFSGARQVGYTGNPATDNGAGNNLHYDYRTNAFNYNSLRDLNQSRNHSVIKTNSNETTKYIWLTLVPTTNLAFNEGQQIYWIFVLGSEKGTLINRYKTTKTSISLDFGNAPTKATGIYDENSWLEPKNFVLLFDDQNSSDPISIALVQDDGAILQDGIDPQGNPYPPQGPAYYNNLDESNGAWATIIPNNLANGIRKILVMLYDGSIARSIYDSDGVWAGISTINIYGGADNPLSFKTPNLRLISPTEGNADPICNNGNYEIRWISRGVDKIDIDVSQDNGATFFNIFEGISASRDSIQWRIPRGRFADVLNRLRIVDPEHPTSLSPLEYLSSSTNDFVIYDSPLITYTSPSTLACKGENVTIEVYATGSQLSYQWYKDGKKIQDATNPQLILPNVNFETSAVYTCQVAGASVCNSTISEPILVYVQTQTQVSKEPLDFYGEFSSTATFSFDAHSNGAPPDYIVPIRWYKNNGIRLSDDSKYAGTASNFLTIKNINYSDTNDTYYAIVGGKCGNDTTKRVRIYILPKLTISPDEYYVCEKDQSLVIPFTIPLDLIQHNFVIDLYKDGQRLRTIGTSGATGTNIEIAPVTQSIEGTYWVVVRLINRNISLRSNSFRIRLIDRAPLITKDLPSTLTLKAGEPLNLSIEVDGPRLSFQWFKNDTEILGANSSSYSLDQVSAEDAGVYYCRVWNCDTVESSHLTLAVSLINYSNVKEVLTGEKLAITVFPNPSTDRIRILVSNPTSAESKIILLDNLGRQIDLIYSGIVSSGVNEFNYSLDKLLLPSGTYFIQLIINDRKLATPIMILR